MKQRPEYAFTTREAFIAIQLAGHHDPDRFPDPEVQAVILKSKAMDYPNDIRILFS